MIHDLITAIMVASAAVLASELLVKIWDFLRPMNLSGGAVARAVGVPRTRIERVADQKMGITADTALRVAKFFGTTPMFWLNLQVQYDLECCRDEIGVELGKIEPVQKKRNRMPPPRQGDLAPD